MRALAELSALLQASHRGTNVSRRPSAILRTGPRSC